MDFEDVIRISNALRGTAEAAIWDSASLEAEAQEMAIGDARNILLKNLGDAINRVPEFSRSQALRTRLFAYFSKPEIIHSSNGSISLNIEDGEEAGNRWIAAQKQANEARGGKSVTPRQALNYWIYIVYNTELYDETLDERFSYLNGPDDAPFWYFLEYGTGPGAYPTSPGTYFVSKTIREIEGTQLFNYYLNELVQTSETQYNNSFDKVWSTGEPVERWEWSAWYPTRDKTGWQRHQHIGGRFFAGYRVEVTYGEEPG